MELTRLRLCRAMGWGLSEFDDLTESEQTDWLAYEHYRRTKLAEMMRSMQKMIDDGRNPDGGAYAAVWLALLEA